MVAVGLVSFLLIAWVTKQRHVFKGPSVNFELLQAARRDELLGHRTIEGISIAAEEDAIMDALRQRSISEEKKQ